MTADVWIAGADACAAGWLVALRTTTGAQPPRTRIAATFSDLIALPEAPRVIAIDMPIGLPERTTTGGREPDIVARAKLGKRQSSVFPVPSRRAIMAPDYAEACRIALETSAPPRKVSKQTWHLFPRIREIDAIMTSELQARVFECHPEVAFWAMNGENPLDEPKKVKSRPNEPGLALRRNLLFQTGCFPLEFLETTHFRSTAAGADDFLDACACAWTAGRILDGTARTFPEIPPLDPRGLRQEIKA